MVSNIRIEGNKSRVRLTEIAVNWAKSGGLYVAHSFQMNSDNSDKSSEFVGKGALEGSIFGS